MRNIMAMTQRELAAFFYSPIAYVVLFAFTFMVGLLFAYLTENFSEGAEASLRLTFNWLPLLLCVTVPVLTMRLFSEEYRSGTIETLMTAPISDAEVVVGKFLGTLLVYVGMLGATLFYAILLAVYGDPDYGMLLCNYFGLLLIGAMFVAIGLFFSSCTRNQIIAALLGAFFLLIVTILAWIIVSSTDVSGVTRTVLQRISVMDRYQLFNRGLVDLDNLVFFCGGTAFFLFLAVKVVESKRWR
ncbi:MAG: ABC transporter permease subunit [Phycisphaerae bacterium]|nr:ABC transporter permease subunit [Phycisphaerae bacterium]